MFSELVLEVVRLNPHQFEFLYHQDQLNRQDQFQNLDMDGNLVEQFKNLGNNSLGNLFNNLCNSVFANPNLLEKLNNQDFQNKVLSLQSNPFEAIKDPEILGIMGEMMKGVKL
jgi:hypothetical protein